MNKIFTTLLMALGLVAVSCAQPRQKMENKAKQDKNIVVAYFSATGNTAAVAKTLAAVTGGTLYEITPQQKYTDKDLDWNDSTSRSSVEMHDQKARPKLKADDADIADCSIVFLGYPIWWDEAPRVVNSFIESHDLKGKTIIPFATSGGSSIVNSVRVLKKTYPSLRWQEGRLLNHESDDYIKDWAESAIGE